MQILLTLKGNKEDSLYFTKPLIGSSEINNVKIFRDTIGYPTNKTDYIVTPKIIKDSLSVR